MYKTKTMVTGMRSGFHRDKTGMIPGSQQDEMGSLPKFLLGWDWDPNGMWQGSLPKFPIGFPVKYSAWILTKETFFLSQVRIWSYSLLLIRETDDTSLHFFQTYQLPWPLIIKYLHIFLNQCKSRDSYILMDSNSRYAVLAYIEM